ncbi:hypothetical protein [Aeromonas sp. MdU4]
MEPFIKNLSKWNDLSKWNQGMRFVPVAHGGQKTKVLAGFCK